ncbi:PREDICTED: uncharacterized protein LOC109126897 [Camelina sativa]|uniref:Uncharacterized protein LOC109126897 n=1 Tax=Camelina sativa TaxID=90675 RepID=A0ABM1QHV6_CAMSA|nr:PREDICTED: uncharacterized protein LOC109126897 [Camelina sativa]
MEKPQTFVAIPKVLKLDPEHYGHWNVSVKQAIQGIDMEAWFAVEDGWTEPMVKNDKGESMAKPWKQWAAEEKAEAKHNSQALSVIFNSLPLDQFNSVQGCVAAKEVLDILQVTFEGTSNVKRTWLDNLATNFENLSMEEGETIASYNSRLSAIAQEADIMGKRYKDKKLVKKFLRSIKDKFQPHRSAIDVSLNSDELKFSQVVGMMQSFEMQLKKKEHGAERSFALKAVEAPKDVETQDAVDEEKVGSLVRKFFKKMERGQNRGSLSTVRRYGHLKAECPNYKRRGLMQCYGCKGYGHSKAECPTKESRSKSFVVWSDNDSDDNEQNGEILNNYVALLGVIEEDEVVEQVEKDQSAIVSDSEDDEKTKEYDVLLAEKTDLLAKFNLLSSDLEEERAKSQGLENQLEEQLKNIRMLSKGTKDLDTILSSGRMGNAKWGLGYQGADASTSKKFFKGLDQENKEATLIQSKTQATVPIKTDSHQVRKFNPQRRFQAAYQAPFRVVPVNQSFDPYGLTPSHYSTSQAFGPAYQVSRSRKNGCWYCGNLTHFKAQCFEYNNRMSRTTQHVTYPRDMRPLNKPLFVKRSGLYCNVAQAEGKFGSDQKKWYFDSGCSRHMTGPHTNLLEFENVSTSWVTFGDGAKGEIKGKGVTGGSTQPSVRDVFLVDGLKANLITVSQLCDEGLDVTFTKRDCKAVDQQGSIKLEGKRSGNNCYMWKSTTHFFHASTRTDTEVWHQKLGHLNIRTMQRLAHQDIVRGIPKLQTDQSFVCGPCNKGKQVKVSHKAVPDVRTERILDLVHMDLMGPIRVNSLSGKRLIFVLVDDFSRYTWVRFLREKSDTLECFRILALHIKGEKWAIKAIHNDRGGEFVNEQFS